MKIKWTLDNFIKSLSGEKHIGIGYALLASSSWGVLPIYWKLLDTVPSLEILVHRIFWSGLLLVFLISAQKNCVFLWDLFKKPKILITLLGTSLLLGSNWFLYIYGVNTNKIVETSLGYFISPLFNIFLGSIFLKERLNYFQCIALLLAALGVLNFLREFDSLPWIALALALTFSFYGLLRKVIPVKPLVGLMLETALLSPFSIILILVWTLDGTWNFGGEGVNIFLLLFAGVFTALPLLWFTNATKRLRYSTLGFIHYMTPTIQLIIGVYIYNEPFTVNHIVTFGLIWIGLIIFSINAFQNKGIS